MGAYNNLLIEDRCPACGLPSTLLCQLHVAATYAGDERGRFALREYRLGERLWWWSKDHPSFERWRDRADRINADGSVDECAEAGCRSCGAEVYVTVRVLDLTPTEVLSVDAEPPLMARQRHDES